MQLQICNKTLLFFYNGHIELDIKDVKSGAEFSTKFTHRAIN